LGDLINERACTKTVQALSLKFLARTILNSRLNALIQNYIISIANTKKVVTKGRRSVSQGQCVATANTKAAVEIKNKIQYKPLLFLLTSIEKNLAQK